LEDSERGKEKARGKKDGDPEREVDGPWKKRWEFTVLHKTGSSQNGMKE